MGSRAAPVPTSMEVALKFTHDWVALGEKLASHAQESESLVICQKVDTDFAEGRGHKYPNVVKKRWVSREMKPPANYTCLSTQA